MADGYLLSPDDVRILRGLIDRERRSHLNTLQRPSVPDYLHQAPETYVALTPTSGIPGNIIPGLGTGTGSGNEPGFADCAIYQQVADDLLPVFGLQKTVYNLSTAAIAGDSWILITRDKYGLWRAIPTATSSVSPFVGAFYSRGDQSIPNNTFTNLIWQFRTFDTNSFIAAPPSANIVIPQTGKYQINAQVEWDANAVGRRFLVIASLLFAGPYPTSQVQPLTTALDATIQQCSGILPLTAGDTVQIGVQQDSGGALTAINTDTLFTIALLK